ncbi:hypothetical protein LTS02_016874 [Friedmanniomyces endolithicus]|nr:hypothetical protein LTR75_005193 [Friedmanniomyces endolithicus]KAK0841361.1 hypothetical protein LTS02_016874 [Friedmanniomyces endolithicus]
MKPSTIDRILAAQSELQKTLRGIHNMTDKAELEYLLAKARFELAHQHYEAFKESAALEIEEVESRIKELGQRATHYGEEDSELEVLLSPFGVESTMLHADAAVPAKKMKAVKAKVGWALDRNRKTSPWPSPVFSSTEWQVRTKRTSDFFGFYEHMTQGHREVQKGVPS